MRRKLLTLCLAICAFATSAGAVDYPMPTGKTFARTFPYSMIGRLEFQNGGGYWLGSGTVIRARSVLTAAHNLWDSSTGWSTDISFTRAKYRDNGLSRQYASQKYILAGYSQSASKSGQHHSHAFANDMGGLLFPNPVADNGYVGYWANTPALKGTLSKIALGYGAQRHSGEELLSVSPTRPFRAVYSGFYDNTSAGAEGGMSGGPVFARHKNGNQYVVGIIVAGAERPVRIGIRALDAKAASFITTYLR